MSDFDASAAANMARELGLTERSVERRRKVVGLEATDVSTVAAVRDLVVSHVDSFAGAFFEHLSGLEEARGLMGNPVLLDRARTLKREHVIAMVGGEYGISYAQRRVEMGVLYARAGLDTRVFLGAFRHMLEVMGAALSNHFPGRPLESLEHFRALEKIAFLDIGIMIDVLVLERERIIRQQQDAIRELSTPVLQVRDRVLLLPIIGVIDTQRAAFITESLLRSIRTTRAKFVVMDVTGVATVDSKVANHLLQTVAAARLMGAAVIVTGLSSEVAQSLAALGIELADLNTVGDLQGGLEEVDRMSSYRMVKGAPFERPSRGAEE